MTPGNIEKAAQAELMIDNGMNIEAWVAQFVADLDAPHVVASEGLGAIDISASSWL